MNSVSQDENREKVIKVIDILSRIYPDTKCELIYDRPFQLLVATILAAQATDKKVNEITKELFINYKTPGDFLELGVEGLQEKIKHINLYRTKAKHIISTCEALIARYGGEIPTDREELTKLSGVGRKTANVVLSYAFGIPAIAVDTHVFRVANRIGLVKTKDVLKTELEMESIVPKELWSKAHSSLVLHGRRVCEAKKPKCDICSLTEHCDYFNPGSH